MRKKATWIIPGFLVLVLLGVLAMVPAFAAPSGATGSIALKGGSGTGLFYSDVVQFNIATATVIDADLSATRTGKARFDINSTTGTVTVFDINKATAQGSGAPLPIIGGEKGSSKKFSGNGSNKVFNPTELARDADDDGDLDKNDVSAKVAGVSVTVASVVLGGNGTFIDTVTLSSAPASGTDNVEIFYEVSEYDVAVPANTPLNLSGSTVKFGSAFATATNGKSIDETSSSNGTVTVGSGVTSTNKVIVTFSFDVKETKAKLVTFSTPSLTSRGLTRTIAGAETTASSATFEAKVGFLSASDFDKVVVAANTSGVDNIVKIKNAAAIGSILDAKITSIAIALGLTGSVTGTDDLLVAGIVPVLDGEVLTSSFVDGSTTRSDTADIDLKAPVVEIIGPASGTFTNNLAQTLIAKVTDEVSAGGKASGMVQGDADTMVVKGAALGTSATTSLVPLLVATNSFQISRSITFGSGDEGVIKWWVPATDQVGNAAVFADTRTAAQKVQGVANPAVLGVGDPQNVSTLALNPVKLNLDLAAAVPITNAAKTGGEIDTRLTVVPTGSHTGSSNHATVLTDSAASLVSAGVKIGDKVTNLTDGSTCTLTGVTATTATCALSGGAGSDWDTGDNYKIGNTNLGNAQVKTTAKNVVLVTFGLGTGNAKIDPATLDASDFNVIGSTVSSAVLDKQGKIVLLTLAADLGTADKPKVELTGVVKDTANNQLATITGTNAITSLDGLAPVIGTPSITGDASSRPASKGTVTIDFSSGEGAATTPVVTATYLKQASDTTLEEDASKRTTLSVSSTGVNAWRATVGISQITGSSTAGLVNLRISLTDAAGNTATAGITDPDGTTVANKGVIKSSALVLEFDNRLNEGVTAVDKVFVVSPNTGTSSAPKTDIASPFITINFDNTASGGGEDKEYTLGSLEVDTHKGVTLTSATWKDPAGVSTDVLSGIASADSNSYVYAPQNLAIGTHTFTLQANDEVGNVSTSVGSTTATSFTLTVVVTARSAYKVPIKPGFNMISIPAMPSTTDINSIINSSSPIDFVMTYDNVTGLWLVATRDPDTGLLVGNLTTMDSAHAYWVKSDRFLDLSFSIPRSSAGQPVFPTIIEVFVGWNVVPIGDPLQQASGTTIAANTYFAGLTWSAAYTFDPTTNTFTKVVAGDTVKVGSGYFLYVTKDGVIIP